MSLGIVGARIRERRRALGITQADLAGRVGISPSYLNLIERNRRGIAGKRLSDIAEALGLRLADLDGAAERRLQDGLIAIAADPRLAALGIEADAAGELIGRYPGWARAIGALARAEEEAGEMLRALSDRMTHDPFLGETVHKMLTRIAAIRSTAEILDTVDDIAPAQARRFHAILSAEAQALSDIGEALAAYFDRADTPARRVTPIDEVEALFDEAANRFPAIEAALEGASRPATAEAAGAAVATRAGPVINRLIAEARMLETEPARNRARAALTAYAHDALTAPADPFGETAARLHYDIERIMAETGLPADLVCRRLTALPRGEGRPCFGYLAANAAGAILDLRGLAGFNPVRHAPFCPLWVICRAQQVPERALNQLASFPSGQRFVFVARARPTERPGFGMPRHYVADMLVMTEADAAATVYAFDPRGEAAAESVGFTCRICPRKGCPARVEDPLAV